MSWTKRSRGTISLRTLIPLIATAGNGSPNVIYSLRLIAQTYVDDYERLTVDEQRELRRKQAAAGQTSFRE